MSQPTLALQISDGHLDTDCSSGSTSPQESSFRRSRRLSVGDTAQANSNQNAITVAGSNQSIPPESNDNSRRPTTRSVPGAHSDPRHTVNIDVQPPFHVSSARPEHGVRDPTGRDQTLVPPIPDRTQRSTAEGPLQNPGRKPDHEHRSSRQINNGGPSASHSSSFSSHRGQPTTTPLALSSLPPASLNRVGAERRTPTIITRTPPMPLRLPSLPPPTPTRSDSARPRAPLRSMPALPVHGSAGDESLSDHEISGRTDSDDEDGDMYTESNETGTAESLGSDDDGNQTTSSAQSFASRQPRSRLRASLLPAVDTSRIDMSFLDLIRDSPLGHHDGPGVDATPTTSRPFDYFSAKAIRQGSLSQSPTRTPRPGDNMCFPFSAMRSPSIGPFSTPRPPQVPPTMHRRASKSMADISLAFQKDTVVPTVPAAIAQDEGKPTLGKGKARERPEMVPDGPRQASTERSKVRNQASDQTSASLQRTRSVPTFRPKSNPPPYPSFPLHLKPKTAIMPREDEGKERLPPYTNSIYLSSIMPRKMEFAAPGVQAKDRKWRRVLCELEGTVFRVYECPRGAAGIGPIEEWWEKKVGVGDVSAAPIVTGPSDVTKVEGVARRNSSRLHKGVSESPVNTNHGGNTPQPQPGGSSSISQPCKPRRRAPSLLRPSRRKETSDCSHSRSRSDIPPEVPTGSSSSNPSNQSLNVDSTRSVTPISTSSSRSHFSLSSQGRTPEPVDAALVRAYTMQHAESGLGGDYLKRKNVIRVRMEGEQFLLQALDVPAVVEWIEVRVLYTTLLLYICLTL
jgi:hypothetical protein